MLLLDAAEWYGGAWASLPGAAFLDLLSATMLQQHGERLASTTLQQRSSDQGTSISAAAAHAAPCHPHEPLPAGCSFTPLKFPQPWEAIGGVSLYAVPDADDDAFDRRCIVDLAPKVRGAQQLRKAECGGGNVVGP